MRRTFYAFLVGLLLATSAFAQTSTSTLSVDYVNTTPAYIAAGTQTFVADGQLITGTPTCAASPSVATTTTCSILLPTTAVTTGQHNYAVTLVAEGVQRTTSASIDPSKGRQPGGIRVTVNVTVQIP